MFTHIEINACNKPTDTTTKMMGVWAVGMYAMCTHLLLCYSSPGNDHKSPKSCQLIKNQKA